jgi:hypothetical protein
MQASIPGPDAAFEWLHRHPGWPLGIALLAVALVRVISTFAARHAAPRRRWIGASFEFLLIACILLQVCEIQRNLYADAFPYVDDVNEPFRGPVEKQLDALSGEHLVLVRYSKDHNSGEEYVYNDAEIDRAKIVWAREIPGMDLSPLLEYFRNRRVWLFEPDEDDGTVSPYEPTKK